MRPELAVRVRQQRRHGERVLQGATNLTFGLMAARANIVPHARSVQAVAAHDEVSIDTNSSPDYAHDSSEKGSRAGKEEESAGYVKLTPTFASPSFVCWHCCCCDSAPPPPLFAPETCVDTVPDVGPEYDSVVPPSSR